MVQATWADPHQKATKDGPTDANEGIITDNMSKLAFITGLPLLSHVMTVILNVSEVKIRNSIVIQGVNVTKITGMFGDVDPAPS